MHGSPISQILGQKYDSSIKLFSNNHQIVKLANIFGHPGVLNKDPIFG
jgi:hypothetical protein